MMKKKVLYLHGFASAGSSGTAVQMRSHLYPMGASVLSPDIPVSPIEAMDMLRKIKSHFPELDVVVGNIATAEALISALDRGDFDWREIINPRSEYNRRKKVRGY